MLIDLGNLSIARLFAEKGHFDAQYHHFHAAHLQRNYLSILPVCSFALWCRQRSQPQLGWKQLNLQNACGGIVCTQACMHYKKAQMKDEKVCLCLSASRESENTNSRSQGGRLAQEVLWEPGCPAFSACRMAINIFKHIVIRCQTMLLSRCRETARSYLA